MNRRAVKVTKEGDYTKVTIFRADGGHNSYRYRTEDAYRAPFLSARNLAYYLSRNDTDEEDEYLLCHALQEDRKVACSFWTRNVDRIREVFSDSGRYNLAVKDTWKEPFKLVFVGRKGCLQDYFDIDAIEDWYDRMKIPYRVGTFYSLCDKEIIDLLTGEVDHPYKLALYSPIILFEGDEVLYHFGSAALIISGLLFGYPLESTANLIESLGVY